MRLCSPRKKSWSSISSLLSHSSQGIDEEIQEIKDDQDEAAAEAKAEAEAKEKAEKEAKK